MSRIDTALMVLSFSPKPLQNTPLGQKFTPPKSKIRFLVLYLCFSTKMLWFEPRVPVKAVIKSFQKTLQCKACSYIVNILHWFITIAELVNYLHTSNFMRSTTTQLVFENKSEKNH